MYLDSNILSHLSADTSISTAVCKNYECAMCYFIRACTVEYLNITLNLSLSLYTKCALKIHSARNISDNHTK